jgi:uncharacterized protein
VRVIRSISAGSTPECEVGAARRASHIWLMVEAPKGNACPICGKPRVERYRPFCSRRCSDVDLNRWLSGVYAVPVTATEDDESAPPADEAPE